MNREENIVKNVQDLGLLPRLECLVVLIMFTLKALDQILIMPRRRQPDPDPVFISSCRLAPTSDADTPTTYPEKTVPLEPTRRDRCDSPPQQPVPHAEKDNHFCSLSSHFNFQLNGPNAF